MGVLLNPFILQAAAGGVDWSNYNGTNNGTATVFNNTNPSPGASVVEIDDTHAFLAYKGASGFGYCRIVQVASDGTVTLGSATIFISSTINTGSTRRIISVDLLSSTRAIIHYCTSAGTFIKAIDFTAGATNTIDSVGAPTEIGSSLIVDGGSVAGLSSTAALFIYNQSALNPSVQHLSIASDRAVTLDGSAVEIETSSTGARDQKIIALSATKAVVLFISKAAATSNHGLAALISVSGTTPSVTNTLSITSSAMANPYSMDGVKLASDAVLFTYVVASTLKAVVVTEAANVLSKGTEATVYNAACVAPAICLPDSGHAVVAFGDATGTALRSGVIEISGSALTALTTIENTTNDTGAAFIAIAKFGAEQAMAFYRDTSNTNQGTYQLLKP